MSNKTINQALKDLFLGLGGDSSALADNSSVSDYVEDLESAIKGAASGAAEDLIDDEEASTDTTYSSTKIESLIPSDVLPSVTAEDIGDVLTVVSDGEEGATWGKGEIPSELPSVTAADIGEALIVESDGEGGATWGKGAIAQDTVVITATKDQVQDAIIFPTGIKPKDIGDMVFNDRKNVIIFSPSYNSAYMLGGYFQDGSTLYMCFSSVRMIGDTSFEVQFIKLNRNDTSSSNALVIKKTLTLT